MRGSRNGLRTILQTRRFVYTRSDFSTQSDVLRTRNTRFMSLGDGSGRRVGSSGWVVGLVVWVWSSGAGRRGLVVGLAVGLAVGLVVGAVVGPVVEISRNWHVILARGVGSLNKTETAIYMFLHNTASVPENMNVM